MIRSTRISAHYYPTSMPRSLCVDHYTPYSAACLFEKVTRMARFTLFVSFLFMFFSAGVMGQYENCTGQLDEIDDGRCNIDNNNADCGYDGGDCCECSCTNDRFYPCGIGGFNCSDPDIIGNERVCYNETPALLNSVENRQKYPTYVEKIMESLIC